MSSYRSASARIGGALASLVMGTVVIATYQTSLDAQAASAGLDPTQTDEIAQQIIDSESSGQDAPPPPTGDPNTVSEVSDIQVSAMIDALYAKAMFGIAVSLAAGLIFMVGMRTHRREDEEAAKPSGA